MIPSCAPPHYSVPLPGWEHMYTGLLTPSDLLKEEKGDSQEGELGSDSQGMSALQQIKMRQVEYYDTITPELVGSYVFMGKSI